MSEVVHDAQHDFWRPPAGAPVSPLPGACPGCGTEFMIAAHFCHVCGETRQGRSPLVSAPDWTRYFEFHHIKQALGLSLASLIAFIAGVGCLVGALTVGAIYAVQNFADFQAIQFWRMEWLLGAVAAFVAGILLKQTGPEQK
jgi:cytosine/uracil/thiamine/allantoin permease